MRGNQTSSRRGRRARRRDERPSEITVRAQQSELHVLSNSDRAYVGTLNVTNHVRNDCPEEVRRMVAESQQLRRMVAEMQRALPAVINFSNANALIITDALGETLTIPWALVPTYDDMHGTLVKHFIDKIGERRVAEGHYCIAQAEGAHGGEVVTANNWQNVIEKRERLVMSILIEQVLNEELKKACPTCGRTKLGTYEDQGWQVCRRCNVRFMLPGKPERRKSLGNEGEDSEVLKFRNVRKREVDLRNPNPPPRPLPRRRDALWAPVSPHNIAVSQPPVSPRNVPVSQRTSEGSQRRERRRESGSQRRRERRRELQAAREAAATSGCTRDVGVPQRYEDQAARQAAGTSRFEELAS